MVISRTLRFAPDSLILASFASALCCVASATLHAQATAVVPGYATKVDGNRGILSLFQEKTGRRLQVIIGAEHLTALRGKRIYEIAFRKDLRDPRFYDYQRDVTRTTMRVLASFSDANPAAPSLTFAQNHSSPVKVFDGPVVAPRVSTKDTRSVASFAPSEAPTIRFDQALPHVPGKSLTLTFVCSGGNEGYMWVWPVDAEINELPGTVTKIGASCWSAQERDSAQIIEGSLRPGMHIKTDSTTPPNPIAAFVVLGTSDKFAFGSLPLPLRIAEPNCDLFVSPDLLIPGLFHRGGTDRDDGKSGAILATPYLPSL